MHNLGADVTRSETREAEVNPCTPIPNGEAQSLDYQSANFGSGSSFISDKVQYTRPAEIFTDARRRPVLFATITRLAKSSASRPRKWSSGSKKNYRLRSLES